MVQLKIFCSSLQYNILAVKGLDMVDVRFKKEEAEACHIVS